MLLKHKPQRFGGAAADHSPLELTVRIDEDGDGIAIHAERKSDCAVEVDGHLKWDPEALNDRPQIGPDFADFRWWYFLMLMVMASSQEAFLAFD